MTKLRDPGSPRAALHQLFRDCGEFKGAADFLGRSESHLRHCADPDDERDLGFRAVCQLTRAFGSSAAAEHLAAQAGGVFLPLPDGEGSDIARLTGDGLKETAEAVQHVLQAEAAHSQGGRTITPAEASALVAELDDVIRLFAQARAAALVIAGGGRDGRSRNKRP